MCHLHVHGALSLDFSNDIEALWHGRQRRRWELYARAQRAHTHSRAGGRADLSVLGKIAAYKLRSFRRDKVKPDDRVWPEAAVAPVPRFGGGVERLRAPVLGFR